MPTRPRTPAPTSTGQAWTLAEIVTRLRRVLRASVRSDVPWERLPMAQVEILQRLAEEPGMRVSALAARHRLAANTVSNLIQQMVVSGLVVRSVDPQDRRAVTVQLTDAGTQQLSDWLDANNRRLDAAMRELTPGDRRAITEALPSLSRLVDCLERRDEQAPGVAGERA